MSDIGRSVTDPLAVHFSAWRAAGRRALIPYVTAGYPSPDRQAGVLAALVRAGADVIELGIPFSDPVADGPTIQRSSQRALEQGVTLEWALERLAAFRRDHETPVVLFSYLNPLLGYGLERFLEDARDAGAGGLLVTDLPVGSDAGLEAPIDGSALSHVRLIAPTTGPERARTILRRAQGFVYYIARTGVTGASQHVREGLEGELQKLRAVSPVPVAVGFGISTPDQAARVAAVADGVVVGSALIDALDRGGVAGAERFLSGLRAGIDRAGGARSPA